MSTTSLAQLDALILDGKFHEATENFCQLARDGHAIQDLALHAMSTAAPYLHVPAHEKLLDTGEFRNVNYDHTMLGIRAGMHLSPWLSDIEKDLGIVQGMYYIPQGLDIWSQLECGFPGHYAREQEQCAEADIGHQLHRRFEDQEPLVEGSVDARFDAMFHALTQGDKVTSYRIFLGLAAEPEHRHRLQDAVLFASIIDQQEYNSFRRVRHIGHKPIRARAMFDLADWVGWERAKPFFYLGVPDICNAPIFHSLYDHACFLLNLHFKGGQFELMENNAAPLAETEQEQLIELILAGDPMAVADAITNLLKQGKAPQNIADVVNIAHARHSVSRLRSPIAYTVPMHSFDYANVVNYWLRNFRNPHQVKAIYLSAWFVTDIIREIDAYPDLPGVTRPDPDGRAGWAEGFATGELLDQLELAVADQDPSRAVALVRAWNGRHDPRTEGARDGLIRMLAHCAGKYQGDAHIFRNACSVIEEYQLNTVDIARKDILFEFWAHFLSFYKKRTLDTDCYDMYHRYFGQAAAAE
ncbi:MAG: hypothetical protein HOE05_16255 [Rhodospirillaceae bacterium]|jgi:hypothetical protein|nr:hypothetical protein [Rhodospirillaceae bacterium]MBT4169691.1 hypothetical protein [Rhodospirillaceae bacterium]MBT5128844.1 hypothetical protein [Rhodospirillaceae bacterium]MBT6676452.1 hypothetical protein [Rhodospirillaceae bacterium]MBT7159259.1 hypothetical protein [Rhodospirillaceae bacterium]